MSLIISNTFIYFLFSINYITNTIFLIPLTFVDFEVVQRAGIQVLSAIIIHFVIVWPISTAFLWFSCDRLDGTRWSGKLQPFVYIRFGVFVNLFRCIQPLPAKDSTAM